MTDGIDDVCRRLQRQAIARIPAPVGRWPGTSSRLAGAKLVKKQRKKAKGASIKPDLWRRTGYVPDRYSTREIHRKSYEARSNIPEGEGTGRSSGSNKRLRKLLEK